MGSKSWDHPQHVSLSMKTVYLEQVSLDYSFHVILSRCVTNVLHTEFSSYRIGHGLEDKLLLNMSIVLRNDMTPKDCETIVVLTLRSFVPTSTWSCLLGVFYTFKTSTILPSFMVK